MDNIADPLTKGLRRELVSESSEGIGLKPQKSLYEGKPNPTDWRSQYMGSIGQPNCINQGKQFVNSGSTPALAVVPWETTVIIVHGIVLREACLTRASVIFVDHFRLDFIQDLQILSPKYIVLPRSASGTSSLIGTTKCGAMVHTYPTKTQIQQKKEATAWAGIYQPRCYDAISGTVGTKFFGLVPWLEAMAQPCMSL
ncbi:hypothetical protein Tco_0592815 [Tanacetum coccineum]